MSRAQTCLFTTLRRLTPGTLTGSKEIIRNQIIGMTRLGNEAAIKFCEDKGWDIK